MILFNFFKPLFLRVIQIVLCVILKVNKYILYSIMMDNIWKHFVLKRANKIPNWMLLLGNSLFLTNRVGTARF